MNVSTELGISPFLLQAISQKISSKERPITNAMDPAFIKQEMIENHDDSSQEDSGLTADMTQLLPDIVNSVQQRLSGQGIQRTITAEDIRQIIALKLAQQAQQNIAQNLEPETTFSANTEPATNSSMINFLSNVAATQSKSSDSVNVNSTDIHVPTELNKNFNNESTVQATPSIISTMNNDQIFMCYNNQQVTTNNITVPSPANDIVVSDAGSALNVVIDQSGQRYIVQQDTESGSDQSRCEDLIKQARYNDKGELVISDPLTYASTAEKAEGNPGIGVSVVPPPPVTDPCPVCGDQVSGTIHV